ncbi:hypothetical protein N7456_011178 [Penicillium angulare]|uniref:Major facilitator superfamily (MFS) profile domain-containing protein n=1 Tax=Penicillium angulare TaxID=116970 RepID=A0A9W9ET48_9EURO|nr:hypothetical protein N7456_011178 [Penicillium angulare]
MDTLESPSDAKTQKTPNATDVPSSFSEQKILPNGQDACLADLNGIKRNWSLRSLIVMWISAGLMSFVINLNNQSSSTFVPYAISKFSSAPLLGTISVLQAVISSVSLQPLARFADVYGRLEMFTFCILMTTIGEIMLSSSANISVYAGAQVFWVIGLEGMFLMLQILAGDSSDLFNRALMNTIPYAPSIITAWITAPFASSVLKVSWRWGFGIFAILVPVVGIPLMISLYHSKQKGKKQRQLEGIQIRQNPLKKITKLDLVGLILLAAGLTLLLVPITLAATSSNTWRSTHIIVMLVIGVSSLVSFIVWEIKWAPWPILSMRLFKSRTVIFGLADYLTTYELVAGGLSVKAATNIYILAPFAAVPGQFAAAFLVKYTKRYKWITVSGYALNLLGLGLAYKYINGHEHLGPLVVSQLILGFGEGVINTMQFGMQASVSQDDMAAVTALYTAALGIGSAIGGAVAGGIWTGMCLHALIRPLLTVKLSAILPRKLEKYLPSNALADIQAIEGSIAVDMQYEWGSSTRQAINKSYTSAFRLMLLVALILEVIAIACASLIEDLDIKQIDEEREYEGIVIGKAGAVDAVKKKIHAQNE